MRLELPSSIRLHPVVHVSQLKPHQEQVIEPEEPVFVSEDDQEFEVKQIVMHRVHRGNL